MHANNHYTTWELLGVKEIMLRSQKSSDKDFFWLREQEGFIREKALKLAFTQENYGGIRLVIPSGYRHTNI